MTFNICTANMRKCLLLAQKKKKNKKKKNDINQLCCNKLYVGTVVTIGM